MLAGERRKELSGGFRLTTNNRMEILAAIVGLETLKISCPVTIHSDSQYLVNAISKGWARRWRARDWVKQDGEKAKNPDLWARLLDACAKHHVVVHWVRGHAGNEENERCDQLAVAALQGATAVDEGYERDVGAPAAGAAQATLALAPRRPIDLPSVTPDCRECHVPLEARIPKPKKPKPGSYYYAWYYLCPRCGRQFMPEEAKRSWDTES